MLPRSVPGPRSRSWHRAARAAALLLPATLAAQGPTARWLRARTLEPALDTAGTWDTARGRLVLFGGWRGDGIHGETWEWDGTALLRREVQAAPPARTDAAIAFDPARAVTALFGGTDSQGALGDTWTWDGVAWTQRQPAIAPPPRHGHAMVHDPVRQRTLLFGGYGFGDTWEWDGATWIQRTPTSSPPARFGHAMVWDAARSVVVLFGGRGTTVGAQNDTWLWNGSSWTQAFPAAAPTARANHAMAFDAVRGVTVLHGGFATGQPLDDVWNWTGASWQPAGRGMSRRQQHVMAFDPVRQRIVVQGGDTGAFELVNDLHEYDGAVWTRRAVAPVPPHGHGLAMAHDPFRARTVLFGGSRNFVALGETWERDLAGWTQRLPANRPAVDRFAMATDFARQRTMLFGENRNTGIVETWAWDGIDWSLRATGGPQNRTAYAMGSDFARQRVVLFGGLDAVTSATLADTWEWDGTAWSLRSPAASPPARHSAALAYDAARLRAMLVGGIAGGSLLADTWDWDGATWTLAPGSATTPTLWQHTTAYDGSRQRLVAFGRTAIARDETWEWDGATWTRIVGAGPAGRDHHAMVYEDAWRRVLLFGGDTTLRDTWTYGALLPATVQPLGTACGGTAPLRLAATAPAVGDPTFTLDLVDVPAGAPCVLALATASRAVPIGNCTLWLDGAVASTFRLANGAGFATLRVPLPPQPSFRGVPLFAQGFALDAAAPAPGIAFSAALSLLVGD